MGIIYSVLFIYSAVQNSYRLAQCTKYVFKVSYYNGCNVCMSSLSVIPFQRLSCCTDAGPDPLHLLASTGSRGVTHPLPTCPTPLIRPPVYGSNGRTYKMLVMFIFFRPPFSEFPRPIALKLCHLIGICVYFVMQVQKLGGTPPKKIRRPKTCKISVDFMQPRTLIANISGMAQDIQKRKANVSRSIPPAF